MAKARNLEVQGLPELVRKLEFIRAEFGKRTVQQPLLKAARIIRDEAKRRAPRWTDWKSSGKPGDLRRGIIAWAAKSSRRNPLTGHYEPVPLAAYARAGKGRGRGKTGMGGFMTAEHAHLVEFGSKVREWGGKVMRFMLRGKWISKEKVAPMQPNPFFWPAVQAKGDEALAVATREFQKIIENAAKRK